MIMEKPGSTIVLQSLIIVLICLTTCDSKASWLQKKDLAAIFQIGDVIDINCTLSDPTINVTLWKSPGTNQYRQVVPNGRHVQQFKQAFRLVNLTSSDDGQYQCRAENITSLNALKVHTANDGIPRPTPEISIQTSVAYGKDVTLKCSAIGAVKLTWYKSKRNGTRNDWQLMDAVEADQTFHPRTGLRETKRLLIIKKFNVSDNGVYICDLYRYYVNWRAHKEKYVGIKGFQKPNFTEFPEPLITVPPDKRYSVYRKYSVEGTPSPSITWYKMNVDKVERLWNCDDSECTYNDPDDYSLDITRTIFTKYLLSYPSDNATFKCVASNSLGSATKTFRLNILAKPKITKKNKENLSFVHVYKEGRELVCKVEEANPNQISFTWVAQLTGCTNADCKPNNSNWQAVAGTESGLKIITTDSKSTLSLEKSEQHFFYRCTASNTVGEDNHVWKVVPVTGSQPLKAVQSLVEVNAAENAELSCTVARFISNQVYWSFNNVALQLGPRMKVDNSSSNGTVYNTLHITMVNVTDAGKYQCFGEFDGISEAAEIQLNVRELNAPSVSLKNLTRKQSSSFLVRCNVSGHPKPRITWKKDGKMLKVRDSVQGTDDCKSRLQGIYMLPDEDKDHATVLVICKADYTKNLGQFSCTARNRLGNDTAKAFVDILAPPMISAFLPRTKPIVLGQEFFLKCVANGNPKPRVWWEKKDKKTSMFKRVKNERSDELHFDTLDESNLGDYRCFAQNKENTSSRNFKLAPSPVTGKSMGTPAPISNKYPIIIGCVSFFIVAIVIIVAVILYKRKKAYGGFYILTLPPLTDYIKKLDPHTPLTEQTNKLPYDAEWEFPRNRLKFSRELGCGAFGKVYLADAMGIVAFDPRGSTKRRPSRRRFGGSVRRNHYVNNNKMTKVAVKTLKEDSGETEYKDLLSELKILIHVGEHKNIVNLLGACTKGRESELWVIIEFCSNGNLLQFLRNRRDIYETEWKGVSKDPNVQLTMTDLVIAAYQVARGMEFLASRLCIHRDLATRNILVTENYVIKIADFGLARDVGEESQYVKTSNGLLPVKWMAIEAIIQRLFTEKSDVWSFGIVLWELFTLGGTPYPNIHPKEVAEYLARGLRMEPPHACPEEISKLMMKCWHEDKDSRPTFKELVEILDKIIELHTSSEGGCGYLEVQGEVMNEYLSPSEVKTPGMDPFECNSPLPPIPSPGDNENDSLLLRDQNARRGKFRFDKAIGNKGRKDSEIEKMQNDHRPEIIKDPDVMCLRGNELDGYIDTSLTGKEKERIERDLDKDRDSSEEPQPLSDYAYWKKSLV